MSNVAKFDLHMSTEEAQFVVNSRFIVNPILHSFTDKETGKQVRLEPRLMGVLIMLAENKNQLVAREKLIKEIWNDYGGADEGLNQAISFLRKLLIDPDKEMIETIPKKGYILHADITPVAELNAFKKTIITNNRIYLIGGLLCFLLLTSFFIYRGRRGGNTNVPDILNIPKASQSLDVLTDSINNFPKGADVLPDKSNKSYSNSSDTEKNNLKGADVLK